MTITFAARDPDLGIDVAPAEQSITNSTEDTFVVKKTLAAATTATLWTSSLALTSFSRLIFEVDPEQELSDANAAAIPLILELTNDAGVVACFNVYRGCPFVLLSNVMDAAIATMTGVITTIKARNATGAAASADGRLTLCK